MPAPWARGAEVRVIGEIHGQQTVNVWHFATNTVVQDGPDLNALLLALAEAMAECVIDTLLPAVTQDWRFVQVDAREIHPTPSDPVISSGTPAHVGQLGVASHSFAASLVNVRTGIGGRSGRGRKFLPPPGEAQTAVSLIDEPTLVLIAAYLACVAAKFAGAAPTTDWRVGVLSQKGLNAVGGTFDNSFRLATQLSPVASVAIMGSRRRGRGV